MKSARMLPKKYHAIAFLSILVMLLLLGLHLLGFGFLSGGSGAGSINAAAALARNSTGGSSSPTGASSTLNPNAVYRHPIVYDKLTGATNNQIQDVLGVGSKQDQFPLDHYQRQQQQQQQQQHQLNQNHFDNQFGGADPFASHLGQNGRGFRHPLEPPPPPPPLPHPLGPPLARHHNHLSPPLPPPPMPMPPVHMMTTTTQSPQPQSQQPAPAEPRSQQQDSLPSASSLNNNVGETRPLNSSQPPPQLAHYYQQQQQQQQQQQPQPQPQPQQPVYYTPPIFTYSSNFDGLQQPGAGQPPPLGVPEVPLSVDEFNSRQNRLRQLSGGPTTTTTTTNNGQDDRPNQVNLLADPQAQQRHKQQMLDRQLLFGPPPPPSNHHQFGADNFTSTAAYYPDPALYQRNQLQPVGSIRPPYATQSPSSFAAPVATQLESPSKLATSQKQLLQPQMRPLPPPPSMQLQRPPTASNQQQQQQQVPLVRSGQQAPLQQVGSSPVGGRPSVQEPACARQLQSGPVSVELANSSAQLPVLFCNQDSEYPTNEVMRALELYASERSIEQLIPQQLVQMLTQTRGPTNSPELQRQLTLDPLQASVVARNGQDQLDQQVFPSGNYESLCSATTWIAQPRRAKTLGGQWKVVVNLPGHKYRGIAISQMVRLEECQKPNGECSLSGGSAASSGGGGGGGVGAQASANQQQSRLPRPRSRCLQAYGNQRLLAWSHQQGLHFDLFRVPVACSCHIRRSP